MSSKRKSRSRIRIHIEKGGLPGYTIAVKRSDRRELLDKLVKKYGWSNIVKKLNVLYIYNMNRYPENAAKFRRDMYYIQKKYSPSHKTSAKKYAQTKQKRPSKKRSRKRPSKKRSRKRPSKKRSRKRPSKKRSKKRSSKKRSSKKRSSKKRSSKKRSSKKRSKKRSSKKRSSKK